MALTPDDIAQVVLRRSPGGYDRGQVDALLAEVAESLAAALREADELRAEVSRLSGEESTLSALQVVAAAERMAAHIRDEARTTAETSIRKARREAEEIVERAQQEARRLEASLAGLRDEEANARARVEAIATSVLTELDAGAEEEPDRTTAPSVLNALRPGRSP